MGFLRRLSRKHDAEAPRRNGGVEQGTEPGTVPEILAGWPSAPAGSCDLCNAGIESTASHRVPASVFERVVQQGYDPYARGRANLALFQAFGKSSADAYQAWLMTVTRSTSDWGLCRTCAEDVASFMVGSPAVRVPEPAAGDLAKRRAALEEDFGADLSAKLIGHLGVEGAAAFAETTVTDARARWSHRNEEGFLTEEEREEMFRVGRESGTNTVETRAAVITRFKANKLAENVALEAIGRANLPEDLYLDLGARIYLLLD